MKEGFVLSMIRGFLIFTLIVEIFSQDKVTSGTLSQISPTPNYFGTKGQLYWGHTKYDSTNNQTKIIVDFYDPNSPTNKTRSQEVLSGQSNVLGFFFGCGIAFGQETQQVIPFKVDVKAMTVKKLPSFGKADQVLGQFNASTIDQFMKFENWNIHSNCQAIRFKNHIRIHTPNDTEKYFDFPVTHEITAIDQFFSFAIAKPLDSGNDGKYCVYKINMDTRNLTIVGAQRSFNPINKIISQKNDVAIASCTKKFMGSHQNCSGYMMRINGTNLDDIIQPIQQSSMPVMAEILQTEFMDIVLYVFPKVGQPSGIYIYQTQLTLKTATKINLNGSLNGIQNSLVNVDIQKDGFSAVNCYPLFAQQSPYQLYLRLNFDNYNLRLIQKRALNLTRPRMPGTTKILQRNNERYVLSESLLGKPLLIGSLFGADFIFEQYYLSQYKLNPKDSTIQSLQNKIFYHNTTNLRSNNLFTRKDKLSWIQISETAQKLTISGVFYDQSKTENKIKKSIDFIGRWFPFATNKWDCVFLEDASNANSQKIVRIDHQSQTVSEMSTNINAVFNDIDNVLTGFKQANKRRVHIGDQCKGFAVDNSVYYLNAAGNIYQSLNIATNWSVKSFESTMTFASLLNVTDNRHYLHKVNQNKTGFQMVYFTSKDGKNQSLVLQSETKIQYLKDLSKQSVVISTWDRQDRVANVIIAHIPTGQPFKVIKILKYYDAQKLPVLYLSKDHKKLSVVSFKNQRYQNQFKKIQRIFLIYHEFNYVQQLILPTYPKMMSMIHFMEVSFTQNFMHVALKHTNPNSSQYELIFKIGRTQIFQVFSKQIEVDYRSREYRSFIVQTDNGLFLYQQFRFPFKWIQFNVQLTKNQIKNQQITVPSVESNIKQINILGVKQKFLGAPKDDLRWIYITNPDKTTTRINAVLFDHLAGLNSSFYYDIAGLYEIVSINQMNYDCVVFRKQGQISFKIIKFDLQNQLFTQMNSIDNQVRALGLSVYPEVKVGKQCRSIAFGNYVFKLDGSSNFVKISSDLLFEAFDKQFNYALARQSSSENLKLFKYQNSTGTPSFKLMNNSQNYLSNIRSFQVYDKKIVAVTYQQKKYGVITSKTTITIDQSSVANNIKSVQRKALCKTPYVSTDQQLKIMMVIYQKTLLSSQVETTLINQSNKTFTEISDHIQTRYMVGYDDLYIYLDQKYAIIRQNSLSGNGSFRQFYFFFLKGEMYLLGAKQINKNLTQFWKRTIFKQVNNQMTVFSYYYFPVDTFRQQYKIVVAKRSLGSITVPEQPFNAPWVQLASGYCLTAGKLNQCIPGCAQCCENISKCQRCASGFIKISDNTCQKCQNNCKTCTGAAQDQCQSCYNGFFKNGTTCLKCNSQCLQCQSSASNCIFCRPGETVVDGVCQKCPSNCLTCSKDFNSTDNKICSLCQKGHGLNLVTGKCIECTSKCTRCKGKDISQCQSCDTGFYLNSDNACSKCKNNCKTCNNDTVCMICENGFKQVSGKCVKNCQFPCETCVNGSPTKCLTCWNGYRINSDQKQCQPELSCNQNSSCLYCPLNYTLSSTSGAAQCIPCNAGLGCRKCKNGNATVCTQCFPGLFLNDNIKCQVCPKGCLTCSNNQVCFSCSSSYFLSQNKCLPCGSRCLECKNSAGSCTKCKQDSNYTLEGWKCMFNKYIKFSLRLNTDLYNFNLKIQQIKTVLQSFVDEKSRSITFQDVRNGSVVLQGKLQDIQGRGASILGQMQIKLGQGSTIAGLSILQSSFQQSDPQVIIYTDHWYSQGFQILVIIIVIVIIGPIMAITGIVVIIVVCYKKLKRKATFPDATVTDHVSEINENVQGISQKAGTVYGINMKQIASELAEQQQSNNQINE